MHRRGRLVTADDDRRLARRLLTLLVVVVVPSTTRDRVAAQLDLPESEIERLLAPLLRAGRVTPIPDPCGAHRYALAPPIPADGATGRTDRP
jgi:hypothetical protein